MYEGLGDTISSNYLGAGDFANKMSHNISNEDFNLIQTTLDNLVYENT